MAMYTNRDAAQRLESLAPLELAEDYDNVGLIVGESWQQISGIVTTLDVTIAVLQEALQLKCNLIVAHHPIWFHARKELTGSDFASQALLFAIRNGISIYSCHTNLDSVDRGVNWAIAEQLELQDASFLKPRRQYYRPTSESEDAESRSAHSKNGDAESRSAHSKNGDAESKGAYSKSGDSGDSKGGSSCQAGSGMIGRLRLPLSQGDFLRLVKEKFHCQAIRYTASAIAEISKVALCGGAGSFLLPEALQQGADAFITADLSYHTFFDADNRLLCLDIGHYESEQFTASLLADHLREKMPGLTIHSTKMNTNPIRCYI